MSFPVNSLPTTMQEAIIATSQLTGIPVDGVAGVALSTAAFAAQGHYDVVPLHNVFGSMPIGLYTVTIIPSGGKKSTAFDMLTEGYRRWFAYWREPHAREVARHAAGKEVWDMERARIKGDKEINSIDKVEALAKHDLSRRPAPPSPDCHFKAFTTAGLIESLATVRPSIGLFTAEAGELFKGYSATAQGGGEIELMTLLTNLWGGDEIKKTTKSGGAVALRNRRASACFLVQPQVMQAFFNSREGQGQGLHGRLLTNRVTDVINPKNDLSDEGRRATAALRQRVSAFNDRVYDMLQKPLRTEPNDPYIMIHERLGWANMTPSNPLSVWYNDIASERRDDDNIGVAAFLNRQFENAHRIAGVIAAYKGESEISDDSAVTAAEIIEYYVEQRLALDLGQAQSRDNDLVAVQRYLETFFARRKDKGQTEWTLREIGQYATASIFRDLNVDRQIMALRGLVAKDTLTIHEDIAGNGKKSMIYTYML